jgi:trypsin
MASVFSILVWGLLCVRLTSQITFSCNRNATCGCSPKPAIINRIVGGETASDQSWSWAVSLSIGNSLCGGSILSSHWVITAAHCLVGADPSQVRVYAGSNVRFTGTQIRQASKLILHPRYSVRTFENDIGLIRLAQPLNMADGTISSICLPPSASSSNNEWPSVNTSVVAIGWGTLTFQGQSSSILRQVTVKIVDRQAPTCVPLLRDWRVQLCAGVSGGGKGWNRIVERD